MNWDLINSIQCVSTLQPSLYLSVCIISSGVCCEVGVKTAKSPVFWPLPSLSLSLRLKRSVMDRYGYYGYRTNLCSTVLAYRPAIWGLWTLRPLMLLCLSCNSTGMSVCAVGLLRALSMSGGSARLSTDREPALTDRPCMAQKPQWCRCQDRLLRCT